MANTIVLGVDLGTTNSVAARLNGNTAEIIRNNDGGEFLPSMIGVTRRGSTVVGQQAKNLLATGRGSATFEFKRRLGTDWRIELKTDSEPLGPEELSTILLREIRSASSKALGKNLRHAVITVPADFTLRQNEATQRAASTAGFSSCPLVLEPVAAALAYGFESESDRVYWLAYDLGGGTFDAALINMRDGMFNIVNHKGDNDLGGGLIDWTAIETVIVPRLIEKYDLPEFHKDNHRWARQFGTLKVLFEDAKIKLSMQDSVELDIETLGKDAAGVEMEFTTVVTRQDIEAAAEPLITRTIHLCQDVLAERNLDPSQVEKVFMIGGATKMPYVRERLSDESTGLGIPLAFDCDPLTVVAQGAAIAAASMLVDEADESDDQSEISAGARVVLDYQPIDSDPEPVISGVIATDPPQDYSSFTIEIVNSSIEPQWRSGHLTIQKDGAFDTELYAQKGKENVFTIRLLDKSGVEIPTRPESFSYRIGVSVADTMLTHSLGLALEGNEVLVLAKKGDTLPLRKREQVRSIVAVERGHTGDVIRIPLIEGESDRADRNEELGAITISADSEQLTRDIPIGTEIDVVLKIDKSRALTMSAYVPDFDIELAIAKDYSDANRSDIDVEELRRRLMAQRERFNEYARQIASTGDSRSAKLRERIVSRDLFSSVEELLEKALTDKDSAFRCENRLRELMAEVDALEDALEWPILCAKFEKELEVEAEILAHPELDVRQDERDRYAQLSQDGRKAIEAQDSVLLRRAITELDRLGIRMLFRLPGWWIGEFQHIERTRRADLKSGADDHFNAGHRAIQSNDLEQLKHAVRGLWNLLPDGDAGKGGQVKDTSGVTR